MNVKVTLQAQMCAAMSRLVDIATEVGTSKNESEFNQNLEKLYDMFEIIEEMDDDFYNGKGKTWDYYAQLLRAKANKRNEAS